MAYYKVRMRERDSDGFYYTYVSAYNKKEVPYALRCELLDDEKEDIVDAVSEISEEEYEEGYKRFGDGERS